MFRYLYKLFVKYPQRWRRILFSIHVMWIMKSEFGSIFGQPQIMVLDEKEFDNWKICLAYQSKDGVRISVDILENDAEVFASSKYAELLYFSDNIKNIQEVKFYLIQYFSNIQS